MKKMQDMGGFFVAAVTPFDEQGRFSAPALHKLMDKTIAEGAKGFLIGGSSAECPLLTHEERVEGLQAAAQYENRKKTKLMASVAAISTDEAIEYAKVRRQFGSRIIDHQAVGFMIADMSMKVAAARALMYDSLRCVVEGVPNNLDMMNKCFVTDTVMSVCMDAVQVLGGYGYMKDYPVERYMRNAKIFQIFGGTNQIKRKNLMKSIAGRDPEKVRK